MARPTITELLAMSDEDLKGLSKDVADELHRRDDVARLPQAIEELTQRFVDRGGPVEKLKEPKAYIPAPKPEKPVDPPKEESKPPKADPPVTEPAA